MLFLCHQFRCTSPRLHFLMGCSKVFPSLIHTPWHTVDLVSKRKSILFHTPKRLALRTQFNSSLIYRNLVNSISKRYLAQFSPVKEGRNNQLITEQKCVLRVLTRYWKAFEWVGIAKRIKQNTWARFSEAQTDTHLFLVNYPGMTKSNNWNTALLCL